MRRPSLRCRRHVPPCEREAGSADGDLVPPEGVRIVSEFGGRPVAPLCTQTRHGSRHADSVAWRAHGLAAGNGARGTLVCNRTWIVISRPSIEVTMPSSKSAEIMPDVLATSVRKPSMSSVPTPGIGGLRCTRWSCCIRGCPSCCPSPSTSRTARSTALRASHLASSSMCACASAWASA